MFWWGDDDGINREGWSEKSKAALRREEDAIKKFDSERAKMEAQVLEPGSCNMIQLLSPKEHLTGACLKTFRQHVSKFKGWSVKRQVVSEDDKVKLKITRKSKVYYTNVYYTTPVNLDKLKENLVPPKQPVNNQQPPSNPPGLTPIRQAFPVYPYHQPISNLPHVAYNNGNPPGFSGFRNYQPSSNVPAGILLNSGKISGQSIPGYQYHTGQPYGNIAGSSKRSLTDFQDHGGKKTKY